MTDIEELRKVSKEALMQKAFERLAHLRKHPEENPQLLAELDELREAKALDYSDRMERWYAWVGKGPSTGRLDDELWMGITVYWS
jgi:hypothetical protein